MEVEHLSFLIRDLSQLHQKGQVTDSLTLKNLFGFEYVEEKAAATQIFFKKGITSWMDKPQTVAEQNKS